VSATQGREEQEDMYASIDLVVDKIQRQLNRSKRAAPTIIGVALRPKDTPGE